MTALSLASLVGDFVWSAHFYLGSTVHQPDARCTVGRAGALYSSHDVAVLGVTYCATCWPGRRCGVCRQPSGNRVECGPCTTGSIADETAYDRTMEAAA